MRHRRACGAGLFIMRESLPLKIWRVVYPAFLLTAVYLAVYFLAILAYSGIFSSSFDGLDQFMGSAGDVVSVAALLAGAVIAYLIYKKDYVVPANEFLKSPKFIISVIAVGMLASHGLGLLVSFVNLGGILGQYSQTAQMLSASGVAITVIKTVILAPLAEELAFRGLVFRRLKEYLNFPAAMLISSAAFAIYHLNLLQGVYAFVFGLLLCLVYKRFNNLIAPMVMHAGANALSVILQCSGLSYASYVTAAAVMAVTLLAGAAIYIFAIRRRQI